MVKVNDSQSSCPAFREKAPAVRSVRRSPCRWDFLRCQQRRAYSV